MKFFRRKPAPENKPKITHSHPSHETFNKRFEPPLPQRNVTGPWLDYATVPHMSKDFGRSVGGMAAEEARASPFVRKESLRLKFKQEFNQQWLSEERNDVLAQTNSHTTSRNERQQQSEQQHSPVTPPPSQGWNTHPHDMTNHTKPTLTLDIEKYQHYLDDYDLSEEEKREFLQTIWNMVCEFVMLGFEVHPLQDVQNKPGDKTAKNSAFSGILSQDMLSSLHADRQKGTKE